MSLTLNATLQTAQDGLQRSPILSLVSSQIAADIPFDGNLLTSETNDEFAPDVIMHSTGRLCFVFAFDDGSADKIVYGYTDTDRTTFSYVELTWGSDVIVSASLCEMTNNDIGIIALTRSGANYWIKYFVIAVTGPAVSDTNIANYSLSSYWISRPYVIKLANDTYLMVYGHKTGSTYTLKKRTSSNFTSWSSESTISISGLTNTRRWDYPQLLQVTNGDIFLSFDFVDEISGSKERINCYYSISTDNGATWGAAVANTNYTTFGTVGRHPFAAQKVADTMDWVFHEQTGALHITGGESGWCGSTSYHFFQNMHFDEVTRKLYIESRQSVGSKELYCVVEFDPDTWTVDNCWDCSSVPAFNACFCGTGIGTDRDNHSERHYMVLGVGLHLAVLNADADTITHYNLKDYAGCNLEKNVDVPSWLSTLDGGNNWAWLDYGSLRLYLSFSKYVNPGTRYYCFGYIDLTETATPYSFTYIINEESMTVENAPSSFYIVPDEDLVFFRSGDGHTIYVRLLSTGALWKTYNHTLFSGFPYHGLWREVAFLNNKLYGHFQYESGYGEEDKRGLCEVDLDTDVITTYRPTWATLDDYKFLHIEATDDNKLVNTTDGYGVTIFDAITKTWELIDNDNLEGMTPDGGDYFHTLALDNAQGYIFAYYGKYGTSSAFGASMFSRYGLLRRSYYKVGTNSGGWTFGSANPLVLGNLDYEAAITYDPDDDGMYALWTNRAIEELSIKWDKESGEFDLTPYVMRGNEVVRKTSIDGSPNQLEFSVSEGHLFDPQNQNSLWASYLEKSRKITMKLGEIVSSVNYWQDQGEFYVTSARLSYEKGKYPVMSVVAQDIRAIWQDMVIIATEYYEAAPVAVLEDLIPTHSSMVIGDVDLPAFDPSTNIYIQWLETELDEIHKQICNRFGYYPKITVDGKYSARKISNGNAVDHTYSDSTFLINFTPDDDYSDFTNQVIVQGEENTFIEVIYAEEKILSLSGTVGWYGFKKDFTKYYSEDKERRCRDPRLKVIESSASIAFELAGKITEGITTVDDNEQYCVVTVEAPDLTPILITAIAGLGGSFLIPSGWVRDAVKTSMLILALQVLASVGNYQYEIWAQPLGKVRRSVQYVADDTALQAKLGFEVKKIIKDPLCFSVSECATVAEHELMIAQMQRNRVRFSKIAHLQDEEGDTLRLPHPYTAINMDVFVSDLTRRYKMPESPDGDGYVLDDIEGWKI